MAAFLGALGSAAGGAAAGAGSALGSAAAGVGSALGSAGSALGSAATGLGEGLMSAGKAAGNAVMEMPMNSGWIQSTMGQMGGATGQVSLPQAAGTTASGTAGGGGGLMDFGSGFMNAKTGGRLGSPPTTTAGRLGYGMASLGGGGSSSIPSAQGQAPTQFQAGIDQGSNQQVMSNLAEAIARRRGRGTSPRYL